MELQNTRERRLANYSERSSCRHSILKLGSSRQLSEMACCMRDWTKVREKLTMMDAGFQYLLLENRRLGKEIWGVR